MTPDDVLRGALAVIDARGWARHDYVHPETGAVCALGACLVATGDIVDDDFIDGAAYGPRSTNPVFVQVRNRLEAALEATRPLDFDHGGADIPYFNDYVVAGVQEIKDLFIYALNHPELTQ